jgi:hypothetical protein
VHVELFGGSVHPTHAYHAPVVHFPFPGLHPETTLTVGLYPLERLKNNTRI